MDARPRLLDQVRDRLRTLHYSYRTDQTYVFWIRRFVRFSDNRHPSTMAAAEIERFLTHLAVDRKVSAPTQSQRLPVVLTTVEVRALRAHLRGEHWPIANLLYGSGLRLMEALRVRVKDLNFSYQQLIVRDGRGTKDRVTILPNVVIEPLRLHLDQVKERHCLAREGGYAGVELPCALARKYPAAHLDWGWQYLFPAERPSRDPRSVTGT